MTNNLRFTDIFDLKTIHKTHFEVYVLIFGAYGDILKMEYLSSTQEGAIKRLLKL